MATSAAISIFCPICYREYSDSDSDLIPRILPCGHSFCTECLGRLVECEGEEEETARNLEYDIGLELPSRLLGWRHSNQVTCPVCKRSNRVQGGIVSNLTKNFALLGIHESAEKSSKHYCQEHDHEQRIYCQECQLLVCAYCQLYGQHKTHKCQIAAEACEPAVSTIRLLHTEVEGHMKELQVGEAEVVSCIQRLERGKEKSEMVIRSHYGYFIRILQQKMNEELEKMQSWSDEQAAILQAQLRSLSGARKTCQRLVDDCHRIAERDPLQALYEEEPLTSRSEDIKTVTEQLPREPIIKPSLRCQQSEFSVNIEHLQSLKDSLTVSTTLEATEEEEEEDEMRTTTGPAGSLFHAQDTENLTEGTTGSPKLFPGDPSPAMATPSSPTSYSTTNSHIYGGAQSPASSSSSDEFKTLHFHQPHYWSSSFHSRGLGDELTEGGVEDDGSLIPPLEYSTSPHSLSVPSILPRNSTHQMMMGEEREMSVTVGSAGHGLHISLSNSGWPNFSSFLTDTIDTGNESN